VQRYYELKKRVLILFLGTNFDRSVYIGTPLCVQVIAPKLEEKKLCEVITAIDAAISGKGPSSAKL
jgi:Asp-tRNA(Asn)/Glu-tRNA(Gln) amidotransferase A subunit family amidase